MNRIAYHATPIRFAQNRATVRNCHERMIKMTENVLIVIEMPCKFLKLSANIISNSLQIFLRYVFLYFTPPHFANFSLQNKHLFQQIRHYIPHLCLTSMQKSEIICHTFKHESGRGIDLPRPPVKWVMG